jgi:two-component system sensor histidine kinase/response regulator
MTSDRAAAKKSIEILIAEDSATQAEQLRYLLEQEGYTVSAAANGRLALEAARKRKPKLVISDVVMPEMDGYALCKAIKSDPELRDVPVVIVTTLTSIQDIAMGLECGADNFLRKPYDAKGLLMRIDNLLSNWELRQGNKMRMGLEIYLGGKKHFITSEREQILDLLISSYEQAIQVNEELKLREAEVRVLNTDLERRAAELEAANRELESFSYSVSHDLRAPLRAISGYSRMLEEEHSQTLNDDGRQLLETVRQSALRMGQLIDDLLEFSRMGRKAIAAREIDMASLVREVLQELQATHAGKAPRWLVGSLPPAWGDRSLIRQVWFNLLSNAMKYSSTQADPLIDVSGDADATESVYTVKDNGVGFDMRYAEKLFGVFQRLHTTEEFPGTGVGLAIVRRVVVRHGGRVGAEGKINEGASFYFTLPTSQVESEVA